MADFQDLSGSVEQNEVLERRARRQRQEQRFRLRLHLFGVGLVGLAVLLVGMFDIFRAMPDGASVETEGVVNRTNVLVFRTGGGRAGVRRRNYNAVVEYSFEADGKRHIGKTTYPRANIFRGLLSGLAAYRVKSWAQARAEEFSVGQSVTVRYLPGDPKVTWLWSDYENRRLQEAYVEAGIGVVIMLLGFGAHRLIAAP